MHPDWIVVAGRGVKAHGHVRHSKEHAVLLERGIGTAMGANEIGASEFTPYEIVRVVHHAHLVGFGVSHAEFGYGFRHHGSLRESRGTPMEPDDWKMPLP